MTGRLFVLAFALAALSAAPGAAQPRYYAPCKAGDLAGVWRLRSIRAEEPGVQAFYDRHPVEYMRFKPDGDYIYVAMDEALPDLAAINASLDRADAADGVSYRAKIEDDRGKLIIYRNGQPFQGFKCMMQDHFMMWDNLPGAPALDRMHAPVRDR